MKKTFLDPRAILGALLITGFMIMVSKEHTFWILAAITTALYAFYFREKTLKYIFYGSIIFLVTYSVYNYFPESVMVHYGYWALLLLRFIPVAMLVEILTSFPTGQLMEGLRKTGIPIRVQIALTVAFQFLPEIFYQLQQIRDAAKIRGIRLTILSPVLSFEYIIIPLLHRSLKVSEEISEAIVTKGIEADKIKTSYYTVRMKNKDYVFLGGYIVLLGIGLCMK